MPSTAATTTAASDRRLLNAVLAVSIADGMLLLVLLYVAFVDRSDAAVSAIGPIHGVGFLILLALTAKGAVEERWGWWFPGVVLVSGGPIGSLVGEVLVRRRLNASQPPDAT